MRTGEPSPRSNVTSTNQLAAERPLLGFPGGHIDAYTDSFAHSPARDCFEHRDRAHSDVPVSTRIEMIRCSADTMRPPRELTIKT
jgi:hypothetical protein